MSEIIQKYRVLHKVLSALSGKKLILLTGARQTGKTTLVKKLYPSLRYINLDAPENRELIKKIPTPAWHRDIGDVVIDEAQKEPSVFEKTKYAWDEGKISFCVLTGSSQILLLEKVRESLSGRISIYEQWPLMICEIYNDEKEDITAPLIDLLLDKGPVSEVLQQIPGVLLDAERIKMVEAEEYILQWGGMPALLHLSDDERWQWLKDYGYTYLERDVADLANLVDLEPFRIFQQLSALRSGQLLNYSEIARDAAVSVDTARRYLEYLHISYQVILLQPYYRNLTSSLVKTPKMYWLDVGILRRLSGIRNTVTGEIYETMIVAELIKLIKTLRKDVKIYFYRTRSGFEVDLLIETSRGILGMEIKSRKMFDPRDTHNLRKLAEKIGKQWLGGIIIYRGDEIKKVDDFDIWAVPSYRLFC
jgi:predicted AAA+ superfamily ATPase